MTLSSQARRGICALAGVLAVAPQAGAQSLGDRIANVEGRVQIVFPSREQVCGDGQGQIGHLLREHASEYVGTYNGRGYCSCVHGPGRIVATVHGGAVAQLRVYVGPVPPASAGVTDLGTVSAADARDWLLHLARSGASPAARESVMPLLVVDAPLPWPELLTLARDDARPHDVRREAMFWLAQGASARLDPDSEHSDSDEVRRSAVFALSQQPREQAVPLLIQVANGDAPPPVRASALFWLGQTGDPRGLAVIARVLGVGP